MKRAWIVSCGTELILGQLVDTNAPWLAERLPKHGFRTERIVTVPDDLDALRETIERACEAAELVLITGGLGPTEDDLTRSALAAVAGVPLELHPPSLEALRSFFAERDREMPEANRIQAMLPRGGRALPNSCGTAPGIAIEINGTPCYALPGVPFEMQAMFDRTVLPELKARAGAHLLITRHLRCFGPGESDLGERIRDLMQPGRNPSVGTRAELGVISLRLAADADSRSQAEEMLDLLEDEIRGRLGNIVFGRDDDSLASVVGRLLGERRQTLATAESCTGGLIGKLLTDIPGSSNYYLGGVVSYANTLKRDLVGVPEPLLTQHGAVSAPVAEAMATGFRERAGSDYGLATTGIAGPTGGSSEKPVGLVHVALAGPDGIQHKAFRFGSSSPRHVIRIRAAHAALNMIRLALLPRENST